MNRSGLPFPGTPVKVILFEAGRNGQIELLLHNLRLFFIILTPGCNFYRMLPHPGDMKRVQISENNDL